jgi:hypothetical protein
MSHTTTTGDNNSPDNSLKGGVGKEEVMTAYSDPSVQGTFSTY